MNELIQKLIEIAKTQMGVHEEGGNNKGAHIVEYFKATWMEPSAVPWCAAFMCWVMREWMKLPEVQQYYNISVIKVNTFRCRYPSAFGWIDWAKKENILVLDATNLAKAGDVVIFTFSHIGLVIADQVNHADEIQTIEGNTNAHGQRDSDTGDSVMLKSRKTILVKNYIRLVT